MTRRPLDGRRLTMLGTVLLGLSTLCLADPAIEFSVLGEQAEYRQIRINVKTGPEDVAAYEVWFADRAFSKLANAKKHSVIQIGDTTGLSRTPIDAAYDRCWSDDLPVYRDTANVPVVSPQAVQWSCLLTGMKPGADHWIAVVPFGAGGNPLFDGDNVHSVSARTDVGDVRPPAPDTLFIKLSLASIALSVIVMLAYLRRRDYVHGNTNARMAHLYVLPALLALAMLTFYPIMYGIGLSFTDADQSRLGSAVYLGLENFVQVFASSGIWRVTLFTLVWAVSNVSAHVLLGLMLAIALNRAHLKGKIVYRTILLLPWAIPGYISVLAWKGMLQPDGLVNAILGTDIGFLSGATSASIMVILVNIWLGVPFMMMSLSGALQGIPAGMFEAADVDGVSRWQQFRHLTLPHLKSTLVPISLLGFIWTFNSFNTIYLMTRGEPAVEFGEPGATDILITYVFKVAFEYGYYGVAAAWSVVIFLMLVGFSWIYLKKSQATEAIA